MVNGEQTEVQATGACSLPETLRPDSGVVSTVDGEPGEQRTTARFTKFPEATAL